MSEPKTYQLSEPLINALLKYLSTRPYAEVAVLISEIQKELQNRKDA